jgi:transcriptional regulator with XRE-family HTH domain
MLGERIRNIRKQKKMTLEALAGEGLTKGMLSLIENNKAKPSMESLAYIAEGLGVGVTDLLGEISPQELRTILEKVEKLFNEKTDSKTEKYKQLIAMIEPYTDNLTQGYEAARLLDIYSRCLYEEKEEWGKFAEQAAIMYDEMNLTSKRAQIAIFRSSVKFIEHEYKSALDLLIAERAEIESTHAYIDPITRVDLDYLEAILHFAVGDYHTATEIMEGAIQFSKQHRIFYRIDDLYRVGAGHALISNDEEKKELYLQKLQQYGEFADDLLSVIVRNLIIAMSHNLKKEYGKALELIDQYLANPQEKDIFESLFQIEKGKTLYGLGRVEEAIRLFEQVETPSNTHHPFDLALFYVRYAYKALCHRELGDMGKAQKATQMAVENFSSLPDSPFKEFALQTYNTIIGK